MQLTRDSRLDCAGGEIRTLTDDDLNVVPLPLGYAGGGDRLCDGTVLAEGHHLCCWAPPLSHRFPLLGRGGGEPQSIWGRVA